MTINLDKKPDFTPSYSSLQEAQTAITEAAARRRQSLEEQLGELGAQKAIETMESQVNYPQFLSSDHHAA